ncbi:Tripartite ATP-independent periplasmic transporter DctQ component [Marinomonas posidonica IVIA-Po-181]|uniref:TRAP transporter small permease protein n=2 Tax=Marinomonas TaxID=28253 RepID=F6D0Q0_MARPP|nr:Tripartite ATP-independent periplasmic transporter DctQ component [Marinomonas posidonica IVIA-Po-181]
MIFSSSKDPMMKRILDAIAYSVTAFSGVLLVVLVFSFGWLVFGRYVLNDTPTWVEQMAMLLVTSITFLAAAVGIHERTHLSVDMLSLCVPKRISVMFNVLIDICIFAFGWAMAVYGKELVDFAWFRSIPLLGIPEGIRYLPVVASGALMCLFSGCRVIVAIQHMFIGQSVSADSHSSDVNGDQ